MSESDEGKFPSRAIRIEYAKLYIKSIDHKGLGVFALVPFKQGEIIERALAIPVPEPQWELLNQTALEHYYYGWGSEGDCIVSGFGLFYNHSDTPNARFDRRFDERVMEFVALRDIAKDEEITIKYGCKLWFEPRQ